MFSLSFSLLSALYYVPLFPTYTTITTCSLKFFNNCSVDLYNGYLQSTTVLFTRNFTQSWLNSYLPLRALSCPFIVQHEQSNECSWSRRFMFSPYRELHCDLIVVYAFCIHWCLCFGKLVYPFLFHVCCCWFSWNVLGVFVSV